MAVELQTPRTPARKEHRRVATLRRQRDGCTPVVVAGSPPHVAEPVSVIEVLVRRDDTAGALIVFVAATLVMVVVVALVDAVARWWVLVPAMLLDLTLTFIVVVVIARLLADDGESVGSGDAR